MHVVGGRGEWSLGEGAGENKRWDGQGAVRGVMWGVDGTWWLLQGRLSM